MLIVVFKWYQSPNCKLAIILFSFSVYPFAHGTQFLKHRSVNKYCKSSNLLSSTVPVAERLEGHAGKQEVPCWWFESYRGQKFFVMITCSAFFAAGLAAFK